MLSVQLHDLTRHLCVQPTAQVEATVSASLDVQLDPVQISIAMPSALQFHSNLQMLITNGTQIDTAGVLY